MTISHLTNPAKDAGQVIGYSHSTKSPKNGDQVAGYAALRNKFLAYILLICGAAKFFTRLAFWRTLNF
jgi:anthranilate phosphoribosyltransferase